MWPKPLPNHWLLGQTIGVSVDSNDHIWIIHRAGALDPKEVYAAANPPAGPEQGQQRCREFEGSGEAVHRSEDQ